MDKETQQVMFSSARGDHRTPRSLFRQVNEEFNFQCDVAASKDNALCASYFTEDLSAFDYNWDGMNWCNPPYGRGMIAWIERAAQQYKEYKANTVMLVPARTDTKWFHLAAKTIKQVRFIKGRLTFEGEQNGAPFPSMLLIWNNETLIETTGGNPHIWLSLNL